MVPMKSLLFITSLALISNWPDPAHGQRNLLHWKRDLEYRINLYLNQRKIINDIVASSIYTPPQETLQGPANVVLRGNVKFTDLVIPEGSLILEQHVARPMVKILRNKTQSYVSSKMIELDQIRNQLDNIKRQFENPTQQFIDKGVYNMPINNYSVVRGNRIFKQFIHGRLIESDQVDVRQINFTLVDKVINDTYMDNMQFGIRDSKSRLFFEGRKTFWRTAFQRPLNSGCCDRLKPLHTSRMMLRSRPQSVMAPVMFQTNDYLLKEPVAIRQLSARWIYNSHLLYGYHPQFKDNLIKQSIENRIELNNLINIFETQQQELYKTLVFRDAFVADDFRLSNTFPGNRLSIGFISNPQLKFDLSHENYLLKYLAARNNTPIQRIAGQFFINSETLFQAGLESSEVNRVADFHQFIHKNLVRIDRPTNISGTVHFNALPSMWIPDNGPSRSLQNVLILRASQTLNVGLLNGMRIPNDIFMIPPPQSPQAFEPIRIRGLRQFVGQVNMKDFLNVRQMVNGMQMPDGVIPLHLNDFVGSVWNSNLWFLNGIDVQHITVESGQFDEIVLRDVHGDAQSLIMRSMMSLQPDGTRLIRAPMRIKNLQVRGSKPNQGLLNGFKPDSIMELKAQKGYDNTLYGKKTFLAHVEADDCIFSDINHLANWTNHLIRTDRPNTVQTVHTKLAFVPQPVVLRSTNSPQPKQTIQSVPSSIFVDRFGVEFYANTNPVHYTRNLNFSPELFILQQALLRGMDNQTGGRYRILEQVRLADPLRARINGVSLRDIVTLDQPFRFSDRFVMVGKVDVAGTLRANRITSNYPIDAMDLVQFDRYRIPLIGSRVPIRLNNLVLSTNNKATFVQCRLLNGIPFNEFANSIMSLTRPQLVDSSLVFRAPVNFEGLVRTESSLNGIDKFNQFAKSLRSASYSFEDGLQCNSVMIRT